MSSFLRYFRLKLVVVLLRTINWLRTRGLRQAPLPPGTQRERVRIPTRDSGRFLDGYIYCPPDEAAVSSTSRRPVLVNWHGSGFLFPNFDMDKAYCSYVAREAGIYVVDADYRKAPETPFPGPVNDVEDVLRWVGTQSHRFDTASVGLSGFSSGGTLAMVASSSLRDALPELTVKIGIGLYPGLDLAVDPATKEAPRPGKVIPPKIANLFTECYAPDPATRTDPRVSPAFADPDAFPESMVVLTCDGDNLAPEANVLAGKLSDGRRKVTHRMLEGVDHGFDKVAAEGTDDAKQRDVAYSIIVDAIKEVFAST
ncbi:hypothetical protein VUR80DRAFT_205 [Thermomyces stellatus]